MLGMIKAAHTQEPEFSKEQILLEAARLHEKMKLLDYSLGECMLFAPFTIKINSLKKEKNAVILAHNYQRPEILFGIADFVGDSYGLSAQAAKTNAGTILFCGVHFMAETAKILSPKKKVLIPAQGAGCSLAESITAKDVRSLRKKYPKACVVCYVNTSAEVKAECDACCTSANALKVVNAMPGREVIFIPDTFMAKNLQKLTKKKIHAWDGRCIVHDSFSREQVEEYKKTYPGLKVLAHTECLPEVVELADLAGGTSDMINYIKKSNAKRFMLVTECGMSDLLRARFPDKAFITPCMICPYMKKIHLENILESLEKGCFDVKVGQDVVAGAKKALDRMLEIGT